MSHPVLSEYTILKNISIHTPNAFYSQWLVKDATGKYFVYNGGAHGNTPSVNPISELEAQSILAS